MPAALEWLVAVDLVRPHPPQTTGVAKPEPKIEPGGQIAEGLHGQYGYVPGLYPVKDFFGGVGEAGEAVAEERPTGSRPVPTGRPDRAD